jgi:penicillin-binding protein 1C
VLKSSSTKQIKPLQLLELLGKPILFLFTFLLLFVIAFPSLIKYFLRSLFNLLKSFPVPSFPAPFFSAPSPLLTLPYSSRPPSRPSKAYKAHPRFLVAALLFFSFIFILGLALYQLVLRDLPNPALLSTSLPSLSTKIYDRHGRLLYRIYRDQNRTLISLSDLPPHLIKATIASEDKTFYRHPGISLSGIARAGRANFLCRLTNKSCTMLQGGSTLTQQLVKNAFLTPEKTLLRKLKEVALAIWTERIYSKDQILEFYFNYVPYGGTAYGVEAASHYYFAHSASKLSVGEASLLAGLPIAPTTFSPFSNYPYLAKIRQHQVLLSMRNLDFLSDQEYQQALSTPLSFHPPKDSLLAPHFVMYVQELLVKQFGEEMVYRGGLEVTTTLDLDHQATLENSIASELDKLRTLRVQNGAGLILDPQSGEILAMVGSRDFFDTDNDGQVNVTLRPRPPGSSIKPLTYALAFMHGYSPTSQIDDSPVCFRSQGSPDYCPTNYDNRFHGKLTLRTALASSYNIPAIKLLNTLGVENLVKLGLNLGIKSWEDSDRFGLALTLGGGEVTMLELAGAYTAFANNGLAVTPRALLTVDNHAALPTSPSPSAKPVIPSSVAYQITNILSDNHARSPAFGAASVLRIPGHQVAVKTGTSNDLRDNWTIGYTEDYLVATWVGNNDNTPMSTVASGITGASPIWQQTMQALLQDSPPHTFPLPDNLVQVNLSCSGNPRYEYFVKGTEPHPDCTPSQGEIL